MRICRFIFKPVYILSGLFLLCGVNAHAGEYRVDQAASTIFFQVEHKISFSSGFLEGFSGTISFDEKRFEIKSLALEIDMDKINTFNELRDEGLKAENFLNTVQYPKATLTSEKVTPEKIEAQLSIRGVSKPVSLDYFIVGTGQTTGKREKVTVKLTGSFNRKDFGVHYNVTAKDESLLLGEDIKLLLELTGLK